MSWSCPFGQSMAPIMRSCTSRASGAEIGWLGVRRSDVERHILQEAFLQHVVEMIGRVDEAGPHEQTGGVDTGRGPWCCSRAAKAGFDGHDSTVTHPDVTGGRLMRVVARQHDLAAGNQDVRLGFGHGFFLTNGRSSSQRPELTRAKAGRPQIHLVRVLHLP